MKIPKLHEGDIVAIEWTDTHTQRDSAWLSSEDYQKWCKEGVTVQTVGIYMSSDKDFLRLVGDIDIDDNQDTTVCRPINIGCGIIKKIDILKRRKK